MKKHEMAGMKTGSWSPFAHALDDIERWIGQQTFSSTSEECGARATVRSRD